MINNERGYVLMESLIGLALLSIITSILLQSIPPMREAKMRLDLRQETFNELFQIRVENISREIYSPHCRRLYNEEICL